MHLSPLTLFLFAALPFALAGPGAPSFADESSDRAIQAFDLTDKTLARWQRFIQPNDTEASFEKLNWLPTFRQGLIESGRANRPLLLYVMNGHPLGCT
ncbi:MAG: hypothetical protein IPK83_23455 [Planctomycetes bacterium]|nr:hypothetical protein [Planctomycetota bacterium]